MVGVQDLEDPGMSFCRGVEQIVRFFRGVETIDLSHPLVHILRNLIRAKLMIRKVLLGAQPLSFAIVLRCISA